MSLQSKKFSKRGILNLSKFLKVMLIVLILVLGSAAIFYYNQSSNSAEPKFDEAQAHVSSEEMKVQTITEIVVDQLLANLILNIEISPQDKQQDIVLSLQASEFQTEDILLKDSYNVLKEMNRIENVQNLTLKWFMPVKGKNTETLTMSFDHQVLLSLKDYTYNDLKQLALSYTKHEFVK